MNCRSRSDDCKTHGLIMFWTVMMLFVLSADPDMDVFVFELEADWTSIEYCFQDMPKSLSLLEYCFQAIPNIWTLLWFLSYKDLNWLVLTREDCWAVLHYSLVYVLSIVSCWVDCSQLKLTQLDEISNSTHDQESHAYSLTDLEELSSVSCGTLAHFSPLILMCWSFAFRGNLSLVCSSWSAFQCIAVSCSWKSFGSSRRLINGVSPARSIPYSLCRQALAASRW